MKELYRKQGSVARWENGTLIHVTESGMATEDGDVFECTPVPSDQPTNRPTDDLRALAASIEALIEPPVAIERLILTAGTAAHETNGVRWTDESRRIHLSMTRGRIRTLLDLGGFARDPIARVAAALARAEDVHRDPPPRLRLAPNVAAALLPFFLGGAPSNIQLRQRAGAIDGRGARVEDVPVDREPFPNWYRPSYRVRPTRAPIDLYAACDDSEIDPSLPIALALLAPAHGTTLRLLIDDATRVYPATVRVTHLSAIAQAQTWYPYAAGVLGAEMQL